MHRIQSILTLGFIGALGCANQPLEPRPAGSGEVTSSDHMVESVAGVELKIGVEEWVGDRQVFGHATPVKVVLKNNSDRDLRIRYQDFSLHTPQGEPYHAMPLYGIEGSVTKPVLDSPYAYDPTWDYDWFDDYYGFNVAPYAGDYYPPEVGVYGGTFDVDPSYYATYYPRWAEVSLPTPTMVTRALPEGVLAPGGYISGYVYFEKVPEEPQRPVTLVFDLVSASGQERFGAIELGLQTEG